MTLRTHLGGSIFAEHLSGRAPTVLALHGWGRSRSDLLAPLEGREVVALDLPGFGASPPPPEAWGAAGYAALVADLLDEAGLGPVLVVGHSFGGRVAAHLAADHPERVLGVVFVGTPLWRVNPPAKAAVAYRVARRLVRMKVAPASVLESMRSRHGSADYRAAEGVMRDVLVTVVNEDYRPQLAELTCPVGFVWGADDTAAPAVLASEAAAMLASTVACDVVEEAGHDVHRTHPDRLATVVEAVAAAIEARA